MTMFKSMLKPGITAGIIGGTASVLLSVLFILALLIPGSLGTTLFCLASPIGFLISLVVGMLAAFFAQAQMPEKLTAGQAAPAGIIAGVTEAIINAVATPGTQALQNALVSKERMIDVGLTLPRLMGMSPEQLEMARAQAIAQAQQGNAATTVGIVFGLICGLAISVVLGAGGAALGALIFKPSLRRKLVCTQCQAAFELGGNAFAEVIEGRPDLVDYCNWDDLAPDKAKQQREVVAQVIAPKAKEQGRQWQCGMCKTVQAY
jgi:hypothetical protein